MAARVGPVARDIADAGLDRRFDHVGPVAREFLLGRADVAADVVFHVFHERTQLRESRRVPRVETQRCVETIDVLAPIVARGLDVGRGACPLQCEQFVELAPFLARSARGRRREYRHELVRVRGQETGRLVFDRDPRARRQGEECRAEHPGAGGISKPGREHVSPSPSAAICPPPAASARAVPRLLRATCAARSAARATRARIPRFRPARCPRRDRRAPRRRTP